MRVNKPNRFYLVSGIENYQRLLYDLTDYLVQEGRSEECLNW